MTYGDIVTKVIVEVFGSDDPQAEVTTNLYGPEGIIANVCKKIQEQNDLWFMMASTTETLVDDTSQYDIDYAFKKENNLRVMDQNGYYQDPLTKISKEHADTLQDQDGDPWWYWIDYSGTYRRINVYPTPSISGSDTRTLYITYWKFLDDLSDNTATFDAYEDELSIEAPYYIIYKAAARVCKTIENYEKMQLMEQSVAEELQDLRRKDSVYRAANMKIWYRQL